MTGKRILIFNAPKAFLVFPLFMINKLKGLPLNHDFDSVIHYEHADQNLQRSLRFTTTGINEIKSYCIELGYNITHFDFDARLIKKFGNISLYQDSLKNYFTANDEFDLNFMDSIHKNFLDEFNFIEEYDYILCSIQSETGCILPLLQFQLKFCLLILYNLKKIYPHAKIIVGGNTIALKNEKKLLFKSLPSYKENPFIDIEVSGMVDLNNMKEILESNKPLIKYSHTNKPFPLKNTLNISNEEDLNYDYKFIFNHYGFDIPDESFSNNYIKQIESKLTFGCNGSCAFCGTKKGVVCLSYDQMKDLIMSSIDKGYNSFFFLDDAINPIAEQFCNWVVQKNLKIHWSSDSKNTTSKEYFEMLFEAGCRILGFGCESFDDDLLKYINKGVTVKEILQSLNYSHDANIFNTINLIFNLPYAKDNDIYNSEQVILDNMSIIDVVSLNSFHLMKNSSFYKYPKHYKIRYIDYKNLRKTLGNIPWKEINGRSYSETLRNSNTNHYPQRLKDKPCMLEIPQHLIFALYDIYKTKDKVVKWLFNNYHKKIEGEYKYLKPINRNLYDNE